jgi:F-type H+-transporting ATPase subunit b
MPQVSFTNRVFRVLPLALMFAGIAAVPFRIQAQEPAPAANSAAPTAASQSSQTAKPEAADSDEAQTNAFRLEGPLVKATAKAFNLSPETAARSFEIINFLIVVLGLGIPIAKWLPKFLRKRSEKVSSDIEAARKVTTEANARLGAIEAKLSGLDGEIAQIRAQVETESRQDETRIKSTIGEESARIVAAAEQEIDASAAQARRSLRNFAADLAIGQAAKQLVFTPETDRALIAEFLGDVAGDGKTGDGETRNAAHQGGQN